MGFTLYPSYAWVMATFCHCARSCVICPARDGRISESSYAQINAMIHEPFLYSGTQAFLLRVTESLTSENFYHKV